MTELVSLVELNEMKQIRVTCHRCGTAIRVRTDHLPVAKACPECGADFYGLYSVLMDFYSVLKKRADVKDFDVHIELVHDAK